MRPHTKVFPDVANLCANSTWSERDSSLSERTAFGIEPRAIIRKSCVFVIGIVTSGPERIQECRWLRRYPTISYRNSPFQGNSFFFHEFSVFLFTRARESSRRGSIRGGIRPGLNSLPVYDEKESESTRVRARFRKSFHVESVFFFGDSLMRECSKQATRTRYRLTVIYKARNK